MNETKRKRLEKRIQRLVAELSIKGLKDPNIGFVTFTRCELSSDARYAKIYVSIFEDEPGRIKTMNALKRATGFIRYRVGKNLEMKLLPMLTFVEDTSLIKAESIEKLIDKDIIDKEIIDKENDDQ